MESEPVSNKSQVSVNTIDDIGHLQYAMNNLNEDRLTNQQFCDFTIKTRTQDFPVHKCLLGVTSEFFKRMFETNMKEKFENCVKIETIEPEIMKAVLNFVYSNSSLITLKNVYEVLGAGDYLQIPTLVAYCVKFLSSKLTEENVLKTWLLAKQYNLINLTEESSKVLVTVFDSILQQKEFLEIHPEFIESFFMNRNLKVSEELIYQSIMNWIDYDKSRSDEFSKLFQLLDLTKMTTEFMCKEVLNNQFVSDTPQSAKKVLETISKAFSEQNKVVKQQFETIKKLSQMAISSNKTTRYEIAKPIVNEFSNREYEFVVVGVELHECTVMKHNVKTKYWTRLMITNCQHVCGGLVRIDDKMYVMGGQVDEDDLNSNRTTECFNLRTGRGWKVMAKMIQKRHSFGYAVHQSRICVAGGQAHETRWLSSVELYEPTVNDWFNLNPLNFPRGGCCLVDYNKRLYVLGGFCGSSFYRTTEKLFKGKWVTGTSMIDARANFAVVVLNGELYAIGGEDEGNYHSSVEKYNDRLDRWSYVPELNEARANHCACVVDGCIFVIGGENNDIPLSYIEMFNPRNAKWTIYDDRKSSRFGQAAIALTDQQ